MPRFADRRAAGQALANQLMGKVGEPALILALPRGGVPVAFEIARALGAPLDIWVVRKIGAPWNPELGLGAVAEGGFVHVNRALVAALNLQENELLPLIERTRTEVAERLQVLRPGARSPDLNGKHVVVVDDGMATGGTVLAALFSIRAQTPRSITVALPVAAAQALPQLEAHTNDVVCLQTPNDLEAVGLWFDDFAPVSDSDVRVLLRDANPPKV